MNFEELRESSNIVESGYETHSLSGIVTSFRFLEKGRMKVDVIGSSGCTGDS